MEWKLGICSKMIKNYKSIELSKGWWRKIKRREPEKSKQGSFSDHNKGICWKLKTSSNWLMNVRLTCTCAQSKRLLWACLLVTSEEDGLICLTWSLGEITLDCVILDEIGDFFFQKEQQVLQENTKEKTNFCDYFDFC